MSRKEIVSYLKNISIISTAVLFFLVPSFFLSNTTDLFILPKQILIAFASLFLLALWAIRIFLEKKITLRITPFNLPIIIFTIIVLLSSILAKNSYDSLLQSIPLILLVLLFFEIMNTVEDKSSLNLLKTALIAGTGISALISILYFFNVRVFPIDIIQTKFFNTYGAILQQILFFTPVLFLSLHYTVKKFLTNDLKPSLTTGIYFSSSLFILIGLGFAVYEIFTLPQKPIVLPFQYGFQIALASISQDTQRMVLSFLFGSGYGTFLTDFTRFKLPTFNQEISLWYLNFSYSSSYFLELISTTGLLGTLSFLFLIYKLIKTPGKANILYFVSIVVIILALVAPLSYTVIFLLFAFLALYASELHLEKNAQVFDAHIILVALKKGLITIVDKEKGMDHTASKSIVILPTAFLILSLIFVLFIGSLTYSLLSSDMKFAQSLKEEALNNGQKTYDLQRQAIKEFPYKSEYFRLFSKVNLALSNALSNSLTKGETKDSAQIQQASATLLQQAINAAKSSVSLSPMTALNWQNFGDIYRQLVSVSTNAKDFSVTTLQQAIALDPYNPQLYIQLGGIYYQLGQFEQAQTQFQIAINLKRDFANAYYNLGHALESKGDFQGALLQYQAVKKLVEANKENLNKINKEIESLEAKINNKTTEASPKADPTPTPTTNDQRLKTNDQSSDQLNLNTPTVFPTQKEEIKLPPPPVTP